MRLLPDSASPSESIMMAGCFHISPYHAVSIVGTVFLLCTQPVEHGFNGFIEDSDSFPSGYMVYY